MGSISQMASDPAGLMSMLESASDSFNPVDWAEFFSALAQVSGGLVGLVFVALTFNAKALGVGGNPLLGALAQQTFADFLVLLLISLLMLVPHITAGNIGVILLVMSALDTTRILRKLLGLRHRLGSAGGGGWQITQRFLLSGLGHILMLWLGIELMRGERDVSLIASLLFSGIMMLLLSGCRSAWLLLVHEME